MAVGAEPTDILFAVFTGLMVLGCPPPPPGSCRMETFISPASLGCIAKYGAQNNICSLSWGRKAPPNPRGGGERVPFWNPAFLISDGDAQDSHASQLGPDSQIDVTDSNPSAELFKIINAFAISDAWGPRVSSALVPCRRCVWGRRVSNQGRRRERGEEGGRNDGWKGAARSHAELRSRSSSPRRIPHRPGVPADQTKPPPALRFPRDASPVARKRPAEGRRGNSQHPPPNISTSDGPTYVASHHESHSGAL